MRKSLPAFLAGTFLMGLSQTVMAIPQIAVLNNRTYRATGPESFRYESGQLMFILFDGNPFTAVQCPFIPAGPPTNFLPFPVGSMPCPAGHNAFISTRFGDREQDVLTQWGRLGVVNEATGVPARLPGSIQLKSGPLTSLPRPSRDFVDRSTLVLHDLQTASFQERDATRYDMLREFLVPDPDFNGDGNITDAERAIVAQIANEQEEKHLSETIILNGSVNNFEIDFPSRPFVELNQSADPETLPRDRVIVGNLAFIEAFPGVASRAGIANFESGFAFTNLDNFGTDFDGDPALLVDFRAVAPINWIGNNTTNLVGGFDNLFVQVVEQRYTPSGIPVSAAGPGNVPIISINPGFAAGDPPVMIAPNHGLASGEEFFVYDTGLAAFDGQRFFASIQSNQPFFFGGNDIELFTNSGLTEPFVLPPTPDGTQGVLNPIDGPALDGVGIVITLGDPGVITTAVPHGLVDGDSLTVDGTGLTALEGTILFAGNTTATTLELFSDSDLTTSFPIVEFPDPANIFLSVVGLPSIVATDQNNFDFPIYPFPFIGGNGFGGQLQLPSVFDEGFIFPDVAFGLFFGTLVGAQNLGLMPNPPRNDLIMRLRFARNVATANTNGGQALLPGDLSQRDFEIELCLVDTLEGSIKALTGGLASLSEPTGSELAQVSSLAVNEDMDGDGLSNFYEFAFDANGSVTESLPAFGNPNVQVSADVTVEIDAETKLCELSVRKRPAVRESIEYYFEEVVINGDSVAINPEEEGSSWEVIADDNFTYTVRSKEPVSGASFFRACARKNSFGIEVPE